MMKNQELTRTGGDRLMVEPRSSKALAKVKLAPRRGHRHRNELVEEMNKDKTFMHVGIFFPLSRLRA
ncbi:hypothetical protein KIN20_003495 [Parelaphostrongylus tenuis]|uniref:Uncharacterized protein n=1 Tax=Parelaphostrongylus tenuis TaxID=148309 RepID=A0AAD5MQ02_PARTN|nr:hypothetical protein KIN20_003495 [Parelaphostrongylus tenuis]